MPATVKEIHDRIYTEEGKYKEKSVQDVLEYYSNSKNHDKAVKNALKENRVEPPILFEKEREKRLNLWRICENNGVDGDYNADAKNEVERQQRLGQIASRPGQTKFSCQVRQNYGNKCAVTGCCTHAALEAAHIAVSNLKDDNDLSNGILLRGDIHALFDACLITLTPDGTGIEISPKLKDRTYAFLRAVKIAGPRRVKPASANIEHHRARFRLYAESDY